jgi:hypothetical protein
LEHIETIIDNFEPICYGTNINQSDKTRPGQVLLSLAGIFLYFNHHPDHGVAAGMKKCIETRWKALDQPMFIIYMSSFSLPTPGKVVYYLPKHLYNPVCWNHLNCKNAGINYLQDVTLDLFSPFYFLFSCSMLTRCI